jgi:hypothetical protein
LALLDHDRNLASETDGSKLKLQLKSGFLQIRKIEDLEKIPQPS